MTCKPDEPDRRPGQGLRLQTVHLLGYLAANLDHPGRRSYTEHTTTSVMVPHDIPRQFRWARASIESAYDGPET